MMTDQESILQGFDIAITALVQSINGLMKKEKILMDTGLSDQTAQVRQTIEKLYVLRNELILLMNEQKKLN